MEDENKKELKDELGFSDEELEAFGEGDDKPYKSHSQRRKEKGEVDQEKRKTKDAEKALKKRKEQLKKAADRFRRKRNKTRTSHTPARDLKEYDAEVLAQTKALSKVSTIGAPMKITPDLERILFPYFISGASIRSIHQQFGRKQDFSLQSLYTARDFYKWEQRRNAIMKVTRNTTDLQMADRYGDYIAFFDDLISESMIRFQRNSTSGENSNPFNDLKIKDMRDLKEIVQIMMELNSSGIKKLRDESTQNQKKMSSKKRVKILEIMAMDDEENNE